MSRRRSRRSVRAQRQLRADGVAIRSTLRPLGVFNADPTHRWSPNGYAKALLTPQGAASVRLTWTSSGHVVAQAWGPGREWALDTVPRWLGADDDLTGFDPSVERQVAELWRRRGPIRLASTGLVWQNLVFVILGQRVTTQEAMRSWRRLVDRCGEPAPGPDGLRLPPAPEVVAVAVVRRPAPDERRAPAGRRHRARRQAGEPAGGGGDDDARPTRWSGCRPCPVSATGRRRRRSP